jgi:LysM repeat protein
VDKQRKPSPEALKAYMSPLNPPPTATTTPSGVIPSRVANPTGFPNGTAEQYHSVSAGETLYAISRKYGLTVDTLKNLNGLTGNKISIGQRIRVR